MEVESTLNMCRLCKYVHNHLESLYDVFYDEEKYLSELLEQICSLQVAKNDGLPDSICNECKNKLINAYEFQKMCIKTDMELREALNSTNLSFIDHCKQEIEDFEEDDVERYENPFASEYTEIVDAKPLFEKEIKPDIYNDDGGPSRIKQDQEINCDDKFDLNQKPLRKKDKQTKCPICLEYFTKFHRHVKTVHTEVEKKIISDYLENEIFPCPHCSKGIKSERALHIHIKNAHFTKKRLIQSNSSSKKNRKECQICFTYQTNLLSHMKVHDKKPRTFEGRPKDRNTGNILICDYCESQFPLKESLRSHIRKHRLYVECRNCQEEIKKDNLKEHLEITCRNNKHACDFCSEIFSEKLTLDRHRKQNHDNSLICTICGKKFTTKGGCYQHMLRHNELLNFACQNCPKKFKSLASLKIHSIVHDNSHFFTCNICNKTFKRKVSLRLHEKKHQAFQYSCEYCDKKFSLKMYLNRHLITHTGEKPHQCNYCDQAFSNNGDLFRHKRLHLGDEMYKCEKCPQTFKYHKDFTAHVTEHFLLEKTM